MAGELADDAEVDARDSREGVRGAALASASVSPEALIVTTASRWPIRRLPYQRPLRFQNEHRLVPLARHDRP